MDRRTTPRWLQVPALALLLAAFAYDAAAMRYALVDYGDWPAYLKEHPYFLWGATWKMFSGRDRTHFDLEAEVYRDGGWHRVDLLALFPSRWESGPRYVRKPFWRDTVNRRILAQSICRRLPEPPQGVRLSTVSWRKTLGQVEQPRVKEERQAITEWDCDDFQPLPRGRRL